MTRLFEEPGEKAPTDSCHVVGVAVNANVWGDFDYIWPDSLGDPIIGQRVHVPFGRGNRKIIGFVTDTLKRGSARKLKPIADVVDSTPQLDETLWDLAHWISKYYLTPLGTVMAAMIPSAVGKHRAKTETVVYLDAERKDWPKRLGSKQASVLDELYEARKQGIEPLRLEELTHHSGASRDTISRLRHRKLVRMESRPVTLPELQQEEGSDPFELNDQQAEVLASLDGKLNGGFSVSLLHGVTGSGKTEVYVRAIRQVVAAGKQAILMVPEIALATQTMQRLLERLPRVAVMHSGLTDSQRAFYFQQIRDGGADVVVGPRSAVFAPARNLGLLIVDEEHESTYKQDSNPRYHGRDVAIKRASIAGAAVILGSATPSLESLNNAQQGKYDLLRLPNRVCGLPMPKLHIVHLRKEMTPGRVELIGKTLTNRIAVTLDRQEQIILLMNRRGYASYVFCPSCKWTMNCDHCTRAMVFHQATQLVLCHYCNKTATLPQRCPGCEGKLLLFGMGIQRIENELARKFPSAVVARMDSDTMTSPKQFKKVFDGFAAGEVDILLGTQMVAKGLDFPKVSLVGVVSADTSLAINDFRAEERTFQLIVQVAGRAGRSMLSGEVVVQTLNEDNPAISYAIAHDYDGFAAWELPLRKDAGFPPYSRLIRFLVRHKDPRRCEDAANKLGGELREMLSGKQATIWGPQPAMVRRIRNQFRFELLVFFPNAGQIQNLLYPKMSHLSRNLGAELVADVDPAGLL